MKVHITNLNGIAKEAPVRRWQNHLAEIGRGLGFLEMGIYVYPSDREEEEKLFTRLDGIIASVEPEDVVFVQLPTGNGERFEKNLILKIKGYRDAKVVGILRDEEAYLDKIGLLNMLDGIWVPYKKSLSLLQEKGLSVQRTWVSYFDDSWDPWHIRRELLEIVDTCRVGLRSKHWDLQLSPMANEMKVTDVGEMQKISEGEIQVAFCVTDRTGNYTEYIGIAMQSIVDHTKSEICFHVIHDGTVRPLHQQFLSEIAENSGDRVVFHQVDQKKFETENNFVKNYSVASLFRLDLPDILSEIPKVIYFDADLVFSIDIDELWRTDLRGNTIAAVGDYYINHGDFRAAVVLDGSVPKEKYFNSGVLVIDLRKMREKHNMLEETLDYIAQHPESDLPDQDALNYVFLDETLLLDGKWNFNNRTERITGLRPPEQSIYHFIGTGHVNHEDMTKNDKLAVETSLETPWGFSFAKMEMYGGFRALSFKVNQLQRFIKRISDPNCKKIYYGSQSIGMDKILELCPPGDNDYFIQFNGETKRRGIDCEKFEALLQEDKEHIVVIINPTVDSDKAISRLQDAGFKQGENYFFIPTLLLATQGGYRM